MPGTLTINHRKTVRKGSDSVSPQEVKRIRLKLGFTQLELATVLGMGSQTIARFESSSASAGPPSRLAERLLRVLDRHPEVIAYYMELDMEEENPGH